MFLVEFCVKIQERLVDMRIAVISDTHGLLRPEVIEMKRKQY